MPTQRIPLFPLHVVLFPGMVLPLHIFEPRYREMVARCRQQEELFGVCLIHRGLEVGGAADYHDVGTTCEIVGCSELADGRLHLMTVGRQRFRVVRRIAERAYAEADVELLPEPDAGIVGDLGARVRDAARAYLTTLLTLAGHESPEVNLPEEPLLLSNLVGAFLQVPAAVRQGLLEMDLLDERLARELALLEEETGRGARLLQQRQHAARPLRVDPGTVSLN